MGAATGEGDRETLEAVRSVVFKPSETLDEERFPRISGYDFNRGVDLMGLLRSMATTGFQASNLGDAIDVVNQMVDVLVTTAGGIEEDLIKCLAPTYKGDFSLPGAYLRSKGLNRIGNLLVPNDNYCKFEDWIMPILDQMLLEQSTEGWNSTKDQFFDLSPEADHDIPRAWLRSHDSVIYHDIRAEKDDLQVMLAMNYLMR
ncbi:hypothetical protein COCNU_01G003150 [Cocos nucifera]|uniref:Deoxyhypusine synthase n=1 Tax=Cocos nucifera TaxID=13894 RepID=A0A8K0MTT7_COCNU|nr:hypothetical protein COCNU_01G003150 [Cocos nucifera]